LRVIEPDGNGHRAGLLGFDAEDFLPIAQVDRVENDVGALFVSAFVALRTIFRFVTDCHISTQTPNAKTTTQIESVCDSFSTLLNHPHDSVADGGEFSGLQFANLIGHETAVRGEKFAGTRIAGQAKRAARKVRGVERDGFFVAVGFAGNLAENPITTPSFREYDGRPQL
jgi:hypothetical protein